MNSFLYLIKRNTINYFKSFKSKPTKAIPYIFFIIILGLSIFPLLLDEGSKTNFSPDLFIGIVTIISLILFLISIYSGVSKRGFSYSMADVNLLFTSPISNIKILVYGFLKEIASGFVLSFFILFQIPILINKFGLTIEGFLILILLIILITFSSSALSLMVYGMFFHFPKAKKLFKNIFLSIILMVILYFGLEIYKSHDCFNSFIHLSTSSIWDYVPLIGFSKSMASSMFSGFSFNIIYPILGFIIFTIIFIYVLCKLKLDFYEDVISSAETREAAAQYKNSGYDANQLDYSKLKYKPWTRKHIADNYSSKFSKAIFRRQLLEYKKTGFYFLNITTVIFVSLAILWGIFLKSDLFIFFCLSVYLLVLFSSGSKWTLEFNNPAIFLIPDSSKRKLFYSTLTTIIKSSIDGILMFSIIGIILNENIVEIIFCIITYITFIFLSTYGGVFSYKLFDRVSNNTTKALIKFLSLFIYILPSILIGTLIGINFKELGNYPIYVGISLYNILMSLILMHFSKGIFDTIEL